MGQKAVTDKTFLPGRKHLKHGKALTAVRAEVQRLCCAQYEETSFSCDILHCIWILKGQTSALVHPLNYCFLSYCWKFLLRFWVLCLKCCWQTERQHLLNRWKWASDGNQAVPSFSKDRDGTNVSFEIAPESSYEFLCKCSFLLAVSSLFIGHSKAKNVMKLVR